MSERPTLEAVAARAGVSRATVSRVVNGGAGVRAELRAKVHRAVDELGYVPNQAARTLVTRRTGAVGVVIAEPESRVFSDPFFARQLRGIGRELSAADSQLVLLLVDDTHDYERVGRYLAGGHVDGALLFSLHRDDPLPAMTRAAGLPTVFGGRPSWPGGDTDPDVLYVDSDNRGGARLAVRHLLDRGRRRIATITGPLDQTSALDRLNGWRDALFDAAGPAISGGPGSTAGSGLAPGPGSTAGSGVTADPGLVAEADFSPEGGGRAMAELLERRPDLDAVFAASDLMASGALRVLREHGRRVPQDVAVAGFDDIESVAEWTDPPLTTIHQDIEGMGRLMARLLLRRLAAEGPGGDPAAGPLSSVITSTRLVVRAST